MKIEVSDAGELGPGVMLDFHGYLTPNHRPFFFIFIFFSYFALLGFSFSCVLALVANAWALFRQTTGFDAVTCTLPGHPWMLCSSLADPYFTV